MKLSEKRLESAKSRYANGDIDEEKLDELLDAIVRDSPPFDREFVLRQADAFVRAGTVRFYGVELERDGDLYYPADGESAKPFST